MYYFYGAFLTIKILEWNVINPRAVFTFMRQTWSNTFNLLLAYSCEHHTYSHLAAPTFFPCDNSGDPRLTTRSMEILELLYPVIIFFVAVSSGACAYVLQKHTDKKEYQIFLIIMKFRSGAVAKSYMRKGFLIYEEMRKYFPIYEEAVSHK